MKRKTPDSLDVAYNEVELEQRRIQREITELLVYAFRKGLGGWSSLNDCNTDLSYLIGKAEQLGYRRAELHELILERDNKK